MPRVAISEVAMPEVAMSRLGRYLRQYRMTSLHDNQTKIVIAKMMPIFGVFFLIACGLGYPVLNRFDPRLTPGLSDVKTYTALVTGTAGVDAGHVRFRVLVPWLAKPFYQLALGRIASWD